MADEEEVVTYKPNGSAMFSPDAYSADEYAGEIEMHWWTPDKSKPEKKIRLDIRMQMLKSADIRSITKRTGEISQSAALIQFQQDQLARLKPSREIARLETKLTDIRDSDYVDDPDAGIEGYQTAEEKAEAARVDIESRIKNLTDTWKADHQKITDEITRLLDLPSIYEIFRQELFVKVIADHSIAWHGAKLDFSRPAPENDEPPLSLMRDLYSHLLEVINDQKKATRKNR